MEVLRPIQASPEFIRDNQYNPRYTVVTESWDKKKYDYLLDYHGDCRVMEFPSGEKCFFCEVM